jgi:excisionase family DNA binding protein
VSPVVLPILLRVKDAAILLSISPSKAYEMIKEGSLPSVVLGGSVRVPRELLEKMVRDQTRQWMPEVAL